MDADDRERRAWPATILGPHTPAPPRVRELAEGAPLVPVWQNGLGGLTFRAGNRFIKFGPRHLEYYRELWDAM